MKLIEMRVGDKKESEWLPDECVMVCLIHGAKKLTLV